MSEQLTDGRPPERVVRFTVYGEPRSKQRARVTKHGTFTPKETLEQEQRVAGAFLALGESPFERTVIVDIDFYNGNRRRRDIDNMAKLVLDGLNAVAFADDHSVVGLNLRKLYTEKELARTEVTIREAVLWPNER
jgi:crossover junction endodeoxyribonuclease RusA